jgi:hypothetical protein
MKTIRATLDSNTEKTLARLVVQMGLSPSMVIREGIRLLAASQLKSRKIVGLREFDSGIRDLGSNKRHLKKFGR